jgi:hypothetical protein
LRNSSELCPRLEADPFAPPSPQASEPPRRKRRHGAALPWKEAQGPFFVRAASSRARGRVSRRMRCPYRLGNPQGRCLPRRGPSHRAQGQGLPEAALCPGEPRGRGRRSFRAQASRRGRARPRRRQRAASELGPLQTVARGPWTVPRGLWTVARGPWTAARGLWTVARGHRDGARGRTSVARGHRDDARGRRQGVSSHSRKARGHRDGARGDLHELSRGLRGARGCRGGARRGSLCGGFRRAQAGLERLVRVARLRGARLSPR